MAAVTDTAMTRALAQAAQAAGGVEALAEKLGVATALVVGASAAAAYSSPALRLRELDVGDQPVGPWQTLDGASLLSARTACG